MIGVWHGVPLDRLEPGEHMSAGAELGYDGHGDSPAPSATCLDRPAPARHAHTRGGAPHHARDRDRRCQLAVQLRGNRGSGRVDRGAVRDAARTATVPARSSAAR